MNSPVSNWRLTKNIHTKVGRVGNIISWTKVYAAPSGFENDTPYHAGIVQLKSGGRITVQFVDFEKEPVIGQKVITIIRRIGRPKPTEVIQYGIKVKPYEKQK